MGNATGKPVVFTDEVNLNHFRLLRVVGKGAFGKVRIVERKDTGLTFALKYIRKDEVVKSENVRNIIRERRMLEHLNHVFLCNLRYSFQDMEYLYIVVDLMNGGDLRFHISRKTFTEEAVRFWIAELGCALRYIHSHGIVHRDVKPDNVLLDSDGHVHLADFNVASDFIPGKPLTSKSGTLAYLAPEVYDKKGYSSEVDWWSLGRPFKASSHEKLAQEIYEADPRFPVTQPPVSMSCLHAISSLLERDRKKRIGAVSFETFTQNPFFEPLDFVELEAKRIEPVFIPSSDKTNFDATYDLEELLLEEAPLEARARKQRPREQLKDNATDKEIREEEMHRMVETLFEPFDYTTVSYDRYPGKVDQKSASVGPPPDWVRPSSKTESSKSSEADASSGKDPRAGSTAGSPPRANGVTVDASADQPQIPLHKSNIQGAHSTHTVSTDTQASRLSRAQRGGKNLSVSGGIQVVLNETGSWSELNDRSMSETDAHGKHRPSGMLGFLSRKRGRGSSPKPQERGVLEAWAGHGPAARPGPRDEVPRGPLHIQGGSADVRMPVLLQSFTSPTKKRVCHQELPTDDRRGQLRLSPSSITAHRLQAARYGSAWAF
ncbi:MAG: hypothetical protein M1825_001920 [Sarcosagium campestre]|nr:MAG: hypothetical protein M1825_001920 [Sarcosagium campestre]